MVAAHLARSTPLDIAAPVRLRGRTTSPAPEPPSPEQYGLLRDPWRASARFVEGRLALVFRAIEGRITVPLYMADHRPGAELFTVAGQVAQNGEAEVRFVEPGSDFHRLARFLETRTDQFREWVPGRRTEPGDG